MAKDLPRRPSETGILIVRKQGVGNTHRDYKVRRHNVHAALSWLKNNNPYVSHINICQTRIDELPLDGAPEGLPTTIDTSTERLTEPSDECPQRDSEFTSVQPVGTNLTEKEHISAAVNNNTIPWPPQSNLPVNEYSEVGLFTKCFPTLFPRATADISHISNTCHRSKDISDGDWLKHLLCYRDGRFARHPRFTYYSWNRTQRQRANETGSVFVKLNEESRAMSAVDLLSALNTGDTNIINSLLRFGSSIRGTSQWKLAKRYELLDMINFKGLPTFFITFSAADLHWPELQLIMKRHEQNNCELDDCHIDESGRNQQVINNPHLIGAFFVQRIKSFVENVINADDKLVDHWIIFEWQHRGSIHAHGLLWMNNCPFNDVEKVLKEGTDLEKYTLVLL